MRKSLLSSKGFKPPRSHGDDNKNNTPTAISLSDRSAFDDCRSRLSGHFNANRLLPTPRRVSNGGNAPIAMNNIDNLNDISEEFIDHPTAEGIWLDGGNNGKRRRAWSAAREGLDKLSQDFVPPSDDDEKEVDMSGKASIEKEKDPGVGFQGFPTCVSALEQASSYFWSTPIGEAGEGSLDREVEEERRMSEDLPFTPNLSLSQPTELRRFDGYERDEPPFLLFNDDDDDGEGRKGDPAVGANCLANPPFPTSSSVSVYHPLASDAAGAVRTRTTFRFSPSCSHSRSAPPGEDPTDDAQERAWGGDFAEEAPNGAEKAETPSQAGNEAPPHDKARAPAEEDPERAEGWYGLPWELRALLLTRRGIAGLYPWQTALLARADLRAGRSLVLSLPTSGGKTFLAEMSLFRCLHRRRRSGMFVLPYVALAEEKCGGLRAVGEALGVPVEGHFGSVGRFPLARAPALWVCTIEKANSLLNALLEEGREEELGCVVVDELHLLGEARRGATLELFLTKLLLLSERRRRECGTAGAFKANGVENPLQILGMSATIPNLPDVARWLRAACYEGDFRPIPLIQYTVVEGSVLRDGVDCVRRLSTAPDIPTTKGNSYKEGGEDLYELATELLEEGSVLIFCASRQQCVEAARGVVRYLSRTPPLPFPPHKQV
ncbi:unnamed protein product [Phytomonas sp. Hart1]|nr:unnamed protein product [Phytomonas sp. Hart1]|eukprot:CCW67506.1 unnamed protein product [Phytomonas sp. isolate Hart1]